MRRREAIWRKYKREDTWTAYKVARSKDRFKLQNAKREILSNKVLNCGNDTRKLFALVNSLTGVPNNTRGTNSQKSTSPFPLLQDGEEGDVVQDPIEEIASREEVLSHPNAFPKMPVRFRRTSQSPSQRLVSSEH